MSEAERPSAKVKRKQRDSSLTRVVPVFEALSRQQDGWVAKLLNLAAGESNQPAPWRKLDMRVQGDVACGINERGLSAPKSLLQWLATNATLMPGSVVTGSTDTLAKRTKLLERDKATIDAAMELIERTPSGKAWHLLEGASFPDAYIETRDAIIVVEGKRTERTATRKTTWMATRDQMLRHIDAAWDARGARSVFGVLIVEADGEGSNSDVPARWKSAAFETVSPNVIEQSLPHRSPDERRQIAAAFVGVTTWQMVLREFKLDPAVLRETV